MANCKKVSLLGIFFIIVLSSFAQIQLKGKVIDSKSGQALHGANVYLVGTSYGAATDKEGIYKIEAVPAGRYVLRASYFGYETDEISIDVYQSISSLDFKLIETSIDINAIVVTGTRSEQQISNSPVLTQLISKQAIDAQGINYLPQVLTNMDASFEMTKDITNNSFQLDGLGAQYTVFLVDGERIAGETKGAVDLSRINPASIDRVEVIKGSASTLYGSNAIGGVVNIITRDVSQPLEVRAGIQTSLYTDPANDEARSDEYAFASVNLTKGKFSSFSDAKWNHYAPFDLNSGSGVRGLLSQEKEDNYSVSQKFTFRATDKLSFNAHGAWYHQNRDYSLAGYPDKINEDFTYGAKAIYYPTVKSKIELSYHADQNKIYDVMMVDDAEQELLDYDNLFQNIRLLGSVNLWNSNQITLGLEYISEKQSSEQNNIEGKTTDNVVVYLQDEITLLKDLQLVPGVRNEFHSSYGSHFTPQVSALFSPGKFRFRATYGQGFRAPSVKELYTSHFQIPAYGSPVALYLEGNPDLKPETSEFFSGSAQFSTRKFDISVNYSENRVDNLITNNDSIYNVVMNFMVMPPRPKQVDYMYANVEEARIRSVNVLARLQIIGGLSWSASYTYADPRDLTKDVPLPNVRKHNFRTNIDFRHKFKNYLFAANLNGSYFGEKKVVDIYNNVPNAPLVQLSDFTLWGINTTHTFKEHYAFRFGVSNLFDVVDETPAYFNFASPGRMVILGMAVNF